MSFLPERKPNLLFQQRVLNIGQDCSLCSTCDLPNLANHIPRLNLPTLVLECSTNILGPGQRPNYGSSSRQPVTTATQTYTSRSSTRVTAKPSYPGLSCSVPHSTVCQRIVHWSKAAFHVSVSRSRLWNCRDVDGTLQTPGRRQNGKSWRRYSLSSCLISTCSDCLAMCGIGFLEDARHTVG